MQTVAERLRTVALALILAQPFAAVCAEKIPAPKPFDAGECAQIETRWKFARLAERLSQPGPTGQHDVLWEILNLCEKDKDACGEPHLEALAEWLLFDCKLNEESKLNEPVSATLPRYFPKLGTRAIAARLAAWAARCDDEGAVPPWLWPEFKNIEPAVLDAAVRETVAGGPHFNPVLQLWLAGLRFASGAAPDTQELNTAGANVKLKLPQRGAPLLCTVLESLARAGQRPVLPTLLELAQREVEAGGDPGHLGETHAAQALFKLLRWPRQEGTAPQDDLQSLKTWLSANLASLKWDAEQQRFVNNARAPELEAVFKAVKPVDEKYSLKLTDNLNAMAAAARLQPVAAEFDPRAAGIGDCLTELVALIKDKPETAQDSAVATAVLACADALHERGDPGWAHTLYVEIPKLNRNLGVALWQRFLLENLKGVTTFTQRCFDFEADVRFQGVDSTVVAQARAQLIPITEELLKNAGNGSQQLFASAIVHLYCGGKVDWVRLQKAMLDLDDQEVLNGGSALTHAGCTTGLRVIALAGQNRKRVVYRALGMLEDMLPLPNAGRMHTEEEALKRLGDDWLWLDANEKKLKYDRESERFTLPKPGAPPPVQQGVF